MEEHVSFVAVLPCQALIGGLASAVLIFTAEMYTIKTAVEELIYNNSEPGNYTIFSYSQSVLQVFKSNTVYIIVLWKQNYSCCSVRPPSRR